MAYGLKYQSDFYNNPFGVAISVKIYKRDYVGGVTTVKTSEVTIEANYQDDNTPIIGSGAKVTIVAANEDMTYLEDMLVSYERQFMCTISYGGTIAFRGYSICDLNERQFLPYAEMTFQFTDYMHRLEEYFPATLGVLEKRTNVMALINELLTLTGLDLDLYINSSLFEVSMSQTVSDDCFSQVLVQNAQFYQDAFTYDNIYDAINKCLQPFSAFLYYYKDMWIIERQEDITSSRNWVHYFPFLGLPTVASMKLELNKQAGDFQYVECNQVVEYDSGLKTLILELRDNKYDSLIFNNYTEDILSTNGMVPNVGPERYPISGQLAYKTWYANQNFSDIAIGTNYRDMANWIRYNAIIDTDSSFYGYNKGLYYSFIVQFNTARMGDSSGGELITSSILNVEFKTSTDTSMGGIYKIQTRFLWRIDGGIYADWWVVLGRSATDELCFFLYAPAGSPHATTVYSTDPAMFSTHTNEIDISSDHTNRWTYSESFNLSGIPCHVVGPNFAYDSLWEALGYPETQRFIFMFLPTMFTNQPNESTFGHAHIFRDNYFGDVSVTLDAEDFDNKIEYHLNENFVKTDTVELYLFDLPNYNYSNGILRVTADSAEAELGAFTRLWTSENSTTPIPLYEVYAKCKFRKYGRTIHRLKGTILYNGILKVFTILTDNNIPSRTTPGQNMTFLVNGFTWDLTTGRYEIDAEEYTEEEIVIGGQASSDSSGGGGPEYDSEGVPQVTIPGQVTGLTVNKYNSNTAIWAEWTPVAGAQGYKVIRYPVYDQGYGWISSPKIIYVGTNTWVLDQPVYEGDPTGQTFTYSVCAYNSAGEGEWSTEVSIEY